MAQQRLRFPSVTDDKDEPPATTEVSHSVLSLSVSQSITSRGQASRAVPVPSRSLVSHVYVSRHITHSLSLSLMCTTSHHTAPPLPSQAADESARRQAGLGRKAWAKRKQAMAEAKARAKAAVRVVGEGEGPGAATAAAVLEVVRLRGLHPTLFKGKEGQGLGITGERSCVGV